MADRWRRGTPLVGLAFVVIYAFGLGLGWNTPSSDASATKVLTYFQAHHSRLDVSSYLTGLSLFFGLFWFGHLRSFLRLDPRLERLTAIGFAGGILFAVGGGLAAGSQFALSDQASKLTPATAQSLNLLANDLFPFVALAGLGALLVAYGAALVRARVMAAWVGWVTVVFGILALTPIGFLSLLFVGVWSLGLSLWLFAREASAIPGARATPPAATAAPVP